MGGDGPPSLLHQLELILGHDPLLDEVGFIHPSQLATLPPLTKLSKSSDKDINESTLELNSVQYDETVFWYDDHKLAISTHALFHLNTAAMHAYMDARRSYKGMMDGSVMTKALNNETVPETCSRFFESEILSHSRAVLVLSCDFITAWNSRKLILLRKGHLSLFTDEFRLSTLVLSYSPKSEYAWCHRRWVIKMIAEKFQKVHQLAEKESLLVKKIAEVHDELNESRKWAELYVADNCCFHYRRKLMLKMLEYGNVKQNGEASIKYKSEIHLIWKEELKWNELLIKRYVGREALRVHRRFLSQCWIQHFTTNQQILSERVDDCNQTSSLVLNVFLDEELQLFHACLNIPADEVEDTNVQSQNAACYILWISKQIPMPYKAVFQQRLEELGLKAVLIGIFPERTLLWESLLGRWPNA